MIPALEISIFEPWQNTPARSVRAEERCPSSLLSSSSSTESSSSASSSSPPFHTYKTLKCFIKKRNETGGGGGWLGLGWGTVRNNTPERSALQKHKSDMNKQGQAASIAFLMFFHFFYLLFFLSTARDAPFFNKALI